MARIRLPGTLLIFSVLMISRRDFVVGSLGLLESVHYNKMWQAEATNTDHLGIRGRHES